MDDFEDFLNDTPVKDKTVDSDSVTPRDASIDISASKNCFTLDDEDDFLSDTAPVTPMQAKYTPDDDGFDDLFNFDSPKISESIPTDSQDPNIPDSITESVADMESNIDLKTVEAVGNDKDEKNSDIALITADFQNADILDDITESAADMESNIDSKPVEVEDDDKDEKDSDVAPLTAESQATDILDDIIGSAADTKMNMDFEAVEDNDKDEKTSDIGLMSAESYVADAVEITANTESKIDFNMNVNSVKDEKTSDIGLMTPESYVADVSEKVIEIIANAESNRDFEIADDSDKNEEASNMGFMLAESYVADALENVIESSANTEININSKVEAQVIDIVDDIKDNTEHPKNDIESEVVDDNNADEFFDTKIIINEEILKDDNVDEKTSDSSIFGDENIVTPVKPENVDLWGDDAIDSDIAPSEVITTPQTPYGDDYDELFGSPSVVSSTIKDPVISTKEIENIAEKTEELSSLNSIPVTPITKKTNDDDDDFMSWLGDSSPTPSKPPATPPHPTTTNNEAPTPIVQDSKSTTPIRRDESDGDNIVVTPTQVKVKALMDNFFDDLFGSGNVQGTPKLTRATLARVVPPDDFEKRVEDVLNSSCDIPLLRSLLIEGGYVPSHTRYLLHFH
jgi:hypothetical protein